MRTHSVVTSAVIASLLLFYACATPIQEADVPKVGDASPVSTTISPAGKTNDALGTIEAAGTMNTTKLAANETIANGTTVIKSGDIPPQNHTDTSTTTTTTTTTTTSKPTTSTTKAPTPVTTTVVPPTTTKPAPPTIPSTTVKPAPTVPSKPTAAPTAAPHDNDRKFDGPSFIGGIILACGLSAIGFVAFKFYKARTEHNYHTL